MRPALRWKKSAFLRRSNVASCVRRVLRKRYGLGDGWTRYQPCHGEGKARYPGEIGSTRANGEGSFFSRHTASLRQCPLYPVANFVPMDTLTTLKGVPPGVAQLLSDDHKKHAPRYSGYFANHAMPGMVALHYLGGTQLALFAVFSANIPPQRPLL